LRGFAGGFAIILSSVILDAAQGRVTAAAGDRHQAAERASFATGWEQGSPTQLIGELVVVHADDFANYRSSVTHLLRDDRTGRTFRLRFERGAPSHFRSGAKLKVRGRALDSEMYIAACCSDGTSSSLQALDQPTGLPSGDQRTLVLVSNFLDASVSCSLGAINDAMFADPTGFSVDAQYRNSSQGRISFSGTVAGSYTLNARSTDACDLAAWSNATDAQATASGIDLASYHRKVYVLPKTNSCNAGGMAAIGGSVAWIFACEQKGIFAHEIAHTVGMDHAASQEGSTVNEYGDWTDPVGMGTWQMRGFNAPHRYAMGWLDASSIQVVSQGGQYDAAPLSTDPASATGPRVLMIRKPDTDEHYYLSYRVPEGFDQQISGWYFNRLSVHRFKVSSTGSYVPRTYLLAGLAAGESFVDDVNGITITLVSQNATSAKAQVEFRCAPASPVLTVSPQAQSGTAGLSRTYTVSVTNSSTAGCGARAFNLGSTVPAGWTAVLSTSSLTLNPESTGSATLTVTSSASAASGTYGATVEATDIGSPVHSSVATATYSVTTLPSVTDTVPPSAPTNLTATPVSKQKRIQLSWTAAFDNVGVTGYRVWRNGALVGSSTVAGWIDTAWTPGATYTYSVTAVDAAANVSAASNLATVTLAASGGRKNR
jgi:hypothetical protein